MLMTVTSLTTHLCKKIQSDFDIPSFQPCVTLVQRPQIDIYGNGVPFMLENELKRNWYFWIFSKFACLLDLEIHSLSDLILCLILKLISFLISFLCLILSWFSFWSYFSACLKTNSLWFFSLLDLERKCDEMKWRYKCISL